MVDDKPALAKMEVTQNSDGELGILKSNGHALSLLYHVLPLGQVTLMPLAPSLQHARA